MKSILTVAAGALVLAASSASACPSMDANQKVTELDNYNQAQHSLVENEGQKVKPDLLAELNQDQKKATN